MYCLDSDVIILFFRGDEKIRKRLLIVNPEDIFITAISLCELFKGAHKSKNSKTNLDLIHEILNNYKLLSLDAKSSEIYGIDFNKLQKMGKQTQVLDLMIASIAKAKGLVLVTRNKKHFENIPDLKVEEW